MFLSVRERHTARIGTIAATSGHGKEKIGYVPRGKGNFTESGFTSAGMMGKSRAADQTLDEESQMNMARLKSEDEEIDQGIDGIGNTVDTLTRIAGDMNSEVGMCTFCIDFLSLYLLTNFSISIFQLIHLPLFFFCNFH